MVSRAAVRRAWALEPSSKMPHMTLKRFRKPIAWALAAVLALGLAGCSSETSQDTLDELTAATGRVDVTAKQAAELLSSPNIVLFDIRTQPEFEDGHITNAYNVDVNAPTFGQALEGFSKAATYMVYGTDKDDTRAAAAGDQMVAYGIGKVYVITNGYDAWDGDKVTP
jgi:rhodanese-related sulfurtransferase